MYQSASEFIEIIEKKRSSTKTKNGGFKALMERLNHPEEQLRCLHVAGTNGKGSTTNYLRSILQSAGYRVGSFTSPHLVVHNDRIRINDVNIPNDRLLSLANRYEWAFDEYDLSMFEIDMFLSVIYFIEEKVDYVVYEVGLGGRLDPTNIIKPMASIIVNIGYDHMELLGDTLEKIAYEKAGIIKDNVPVFTCEDKEECLSVFNEISKEHNTEVYRCYAPLGELKDQKLHFDYLGYSIDLNTIALYQVKNASLALMCAKYLKDNHLVELTDDAIVNGLQSTFWKGRFEVLRNNPYIIVDGAHNEHGVNGIIDTIKSLPRPLCIVVSILKDKEYHKMLTILKSLADELVITTFESYRSSSVQELSEGVEATVIEDYREAISYAEEKYESGTILCTGSLYFVSDIRALYVKEE